tara:strand:- start:497 stop:1891 length:1395 start_codon:yes stop_codon:yes gene_type:complete
MPRTTIRSEDITDLQVKTADMAVDAIGVAELSATGTASATTFLRGDNSWTVVEDNTTQWQAVKTAAFTAVAGNGYPCNTTSAAITCTLPATASVGDTIEFMDYARTWGTNALTLNTNSLNFQGNPTHGGGSFPTYNTEGQSVRIVYADATQGWIPTSDDDVTLETAQTYAIEWLVVGGGGSGGTGYRSGGGGAGGYRNSYASEQSGRLSTGEPAWTSGGFGDGAITVTIGAGGQSGPAATPGVGGGTSSIAASLETTVSSYGGGGGGTYPAPHGPAPAGTWGSGAGAGNADADDSGSSGTAGQGFDGGGAINTPPSQGAGGAGAGQAGFQNDGVLNEMNGGAGMASLITGTSVYRAGGGAGGGYSPSGGTGGSGGGGDGGSTSTAPASYGASASNASDGYNSGSGGGGAAYNTGSNGLGDGDDGIVFLRMATSNYTGTTTGTPTVLTDGSDTILVFQASGSYTR